MELLKSNPYIPFIKATPPTHTNDKLITVQTHKVDWYCINVLCEEGGIYMDFHTVCVKPLDKLLEKKLQNMFSTCK